MKKWFLFILIGYCLACSENETEKHQGKRGNVVDVSEKLIEIEINDYIFNKIVRPYIFNDYLVIGDSKSFDKLIYIFDKDNFRYIASVGKLGRGPGEITAMGQVGFDNTNNQLLVADLSKLCVFAYSMDSLMSNPQHFPYIKTRLELMSCMIDYMYFNDTLSIGILGEPTSNSTFRESLAKWNMTSGEIVKMPYEHPDIYIDDKHICFDVSEKYGLYVECYKYHDLMTICAMDGNLKYNIYGNYWDATKSRKEYYHGKVKFCGDKILVSYLGENNVDANGSTVYPTKFLVYDINGDYIKTMETGRSILFFCYDEENKRLILTLDDAMQVAYIDLGDFFSSEEYEYHLN